MTETWRPLWHFSARRHWINDPNGLIWHDGEWHLFYQCNPFGVQWGHMSWGHAVSADLLDWHELPVAIPEDERASIFSGSVVLDRHNSSGLGTLSNPPLVAIYTGCLRRPEGGQAQELAFSIDRGRTWTKFDRNPVLDLGLRDFRDPKVFWHDRSARWVMLVVLPDARSVQFWSSRNLREWVWLSDFAAPFEGQGIWECPDLIHLGQQEGDDLWMLKVDVLQGHPGGDAGARIFFGRFDGQLFCAEPEERPRWADGGNDFYAALSWAAVPDGRALWLAWMNNHRVAKDIPTESFRGSMSVPRELSVRRSQGRWQLLQQPIRELQAWRGAARSRLAMTAGTTPTDLLELLPCGAAAAALDIELVVHAFEPDSSLCLLVRWAGAADPLCAMRVGLQRLADGQVLAFVDRSHAGHHPAGDPIWGQRRFGTEPLAPDGVWRLRALLDAGSVEIFAGDGESVLTEQFLPDPGHMGLALLAEKGRASCDVSVRPISRPCVASAA